MWARKASQRHQSGAGNDVADLAQGLGNGLYLVPGLAAAYIGGFVMGLITARLFEDSERLAYQRGRGNG